MRRFTVLLACGWLMFTPPVGWKPGDPVELTKWKLEQGYEHGITCTRTVWGWARLLRGDKLVWLDPTGVSKQRMMDLANAKCVPSDAIGFKLK